MESWYGRRWGVVVALFAASLLLPSVRSAAADADADGLPDDLERRLGTDPARAEVAAEVWSTPATAAIPGTDAGASARALRRVLLANVAADRWLWVLEFAGEYQTANSNLLLYLDADNNPRRGQRDKELQGTDFVIWFSDGGRWCHAYTATGEGGRPAPTRFGVLGNRVLFCTDMPLAQKDGASVFRACARSELLEPRTQISATGWFEVSAPPQPAGSKPPVMPFSTEATGTADRDGDGLADTLEERLGTDPAFAESFEPIFDSATGPDAEARRRKLAAMPERTMARAACASVGAGRFAWCIEFGADYPVANSGFILYLDADNDPKTGRRDLPGVDYMLGVSDGNGSMTAFAPNGDGVTGPAVRCASVGPRLYISSDVPLRQENGRSVYRAILLSETRSPARGIDRADGFAVCAAGASERPLPRGLDSITASEGVGMTRGLDLFRKLKADPANAVVRIGNCEFEGFMDDLGAEYKEPSAIRTVPGGRILATVPRPGRFHIGVLLYDQAGTERLEIRRAGRRLGVAVAAENDNRTKLFFTHAALDLQAGEVIELRTPFSGDSYRVEDILLLARPPEVRPRHLELSHLEVTPLWQGEVARADAVRVTWITSWPTACALNCGDRTLTEPEPLANHRLTLDGLTPGRSYTLAVTAPKPDGNGTVRERLTFRAGAPTVKADIERAALPLHVINPSTDGLSNWPVTSGIPFPAGAITSARQMRLLDAAGTEAPLQARTLARWPDGSVKWALLSFRANGAARATMPYTLEYGAAVQPQPAAMGVRVEETATGLRLCTGPLQVDLRRAAPALPGRVAVDRNGDGTFADDEVVMAGDDTAAVALVDAAGRSYTSLGAAEVMQVEESGPERAVVLLRGHHTGRDGARLFAWEARLVAAAGQRALRLFYTFGNDVTAADFTSLQSLGLSLPLAGGATRYELGAEPPLAGPAEQAPSLFQDFDNHYRLTARDSRHEGRRAPGWLRLSGRNGTMTVAVRDFWQLYPKGIAADARGIRVDLLPALTGNPYAKEAADPEQRVHLYYNLADGLYRFRQGQSKTHEILVSFETEPTRVGLDAFQTGVMAAAPSDWTCASGVFGEVPPTGTAWSSRLDPRQSRSVAGYLKARDERRDYGLMNFGDWWGERVHNWANLEYDDTHVFLRHFARTGDMAAWTAGDRGAKHFADVDVIRYHADPRRVGAGYTHCIGHVGGFLSSLPVDGGSLTGGHSPCHTRTEGLVEHYLLTGDPRSLEAALGIADRYGGWWLNNYDFANCRVPGWHLILTMALYQATADPFYLNAARIVADRVLERETPGGGWRRNLVPGHCFCLPRHRGNAGFMVGVLLSGLKYYHQASGDPRAADAVVRGARYLVSEIYDTEAHQFRYTSCPNSPLTDSTANLGCEGIAYAARLSRDPALGAIAAEVAGRMVARAYGSASTTRFLPQTAWDMDRLAPDAYRLAASRDGAAIVVANPTGEEFTLLLAEAGPEASVEVFGPDGRALSLTESRTAMGQRQLTCAAGGARGLYRLRARDVARLVTSLDAEAVAIGEPVALVLPGRLSLQVATPPGAAGAFLLKGLSKGRYSARLVGPDGHELAAASWRGGPAAEWERLPCASPADAGESCRLEIRGPAGSLLVRAEGLPAYLSAPSGKFLNAGRPVAAFEARSPLLPGSGLTLWLDGSGSTDADHDIAAYAWSVAGGPTLSGPQVSLDLNGLPPALRDSGEIAVALTVRDAFGYTDTATRTLSLAPAWLLALDPATAVLVEAESFSAQGNGEVRIYDRIGNSGRMVTYWHESPNHWLEWSLNVPREGDYRIVLKYATDSVGTTRDLTIDGQYPGEAFKRFHLPATGGFCTARNDWRYATIGGQETPATLRLSAGKHVLRMANLGDGCALDFIVLAPAR